MWISHRREIQNTHISPSLEWFADSLRQRANARNVSFQISLQWPIHFINPVDKEIRVCSLKLN